MKNFLLSIFLLIGVYGKAQIQTPNWLWAKNARGTQPDEINGTAVDLNGNLYVAGATSSSMIIFENDTLIKSGNGDNLFIAKYNPSGDVLWAKNAAGSNFENKCNSISVDPMGNVYITGYFTSPIIIFGIDTLIDSSNGYDSDIFVVKYDSSGNVLWAKNPSGTGSEFGNSICSDPDGNVYITGYFADSFSGDTLIFGPDTLISDYSSQDVFIAKYDSSGNALWAKRLGGNSSDIGSSIVTDGNGNIYLAGCFLSSTIKFSSDSLNRTGNGFDMFIIKYDPSGNVLWAKSIGTINVTAFSYEAISTDPNDNVFLTGYFENSSLSLGNAMLTNAGGSDIFIVKYDANGNVIWAKSAGGSNNETVNSISVDNYGNAYVSGGFNSSTMDISDLTLTNTDLAGMYRDVFLAAYSTSGNIVWAQSIGGYNSDEGKSIKIGANGNKYLSGNFNSSSVVFSNDTLTNTGLRDIFVAKFNVVAGTGIPRESNFPEKFNIYPNPTNGIFTVAAETATPFQIILYNILGKEVFRSESLRNFEIDLSSQPKGIYLLKIISDTSFQCKKVIYE